MIKHITAILALAIGFMAFFAAGCISTYRTVISEMEITHDDSHYYVTVFDRVEVYDYSPDPAEQIMLDGFFTQLSADAEQYATVSEREFEELCDIADDGFPAIEPEVSDEAPTEIPEGFDAEPPVFELQPTPCTRFDHICPEVEIENNDFLRGCIAAVENCYVLYDPECGTVTVGMNFTDGTGLESYEIPVYIITEEEV